MDEKKPPKTAWAATAASYEEAVAACRGPEALLFPVLMAPWGAESGGTACRVFWGIDEITPEHIKQLLATAYPLQGVRRLHLISVENQLKTDPWRSVLTNPSVLLPRH